MNGRKGRIIGDVALQEARRQEMEVMVIAEPAGGVEKTTRHPDWVVRHWANNLTVYVRRGVEVEVRGFAEFARIGSHVIATYLKPTYNARTMMSKLRQFATVGHTIIGDINSCGGRKRQALEQWLENGEWRETSAIQHTHEWRDHKCSIDKILTKHNTRALAVEDSWVANSDHAFIAMEAQSEYQKVKRYTTDWDAVKKWAEENSAKEGREWDSTAEYGAAYREVVIRMKTEWQRELTICKRSKKWWKRRNGRN